MLFIGPDCVQDLRAVRPEAALLETPLVGLSESQIGRRVKAAGLGKGFTGLSGRIGMARDLSASGVELPALMTAGRWSSPEMPSRYTRNEEAGRGVDRTNHCSLREPPLTSGPGDPGGMGPQPQGETVLRDHASRLA